MPNSLYMSAPSKQAERVFFNGIQLSYDENGDPPKLSSVKGQFIDSLVETIKSYFPEEHFAAFEVIYQ